MPSRFTFAKRFRRRWVVAIGALILALGGTYVAAWHYHLKRFQVVRPGTLIRTAQPTEWGLRYLVNERGVKTVLSLQLFDWRLKSGALDWGDPDGEKESRFVRELGANYVQWPMGEEACWPWPTPWQLEEFFRLFDNPANSPVAIHCMGGRHRTGSIAALFRLEYDRWPVEKTLAEMYSFDFGGGIDVHEHNLRTYAPRPLPSDQEWQALAESLAGLVDESDRQSFERLAWRLRERQNEPDVAGAILNYLRERRPFGLALAARILDDAESPLAQAAADWAAARMAYGLLAEKDAGDDWTTIGAVLADFGSLKQQAVLVERLRDVAFRESHPGRFEQLAMGVLNRYTPNRVAYWRTLLDDETSWRRAESAAFRYCDTAVARLAVVADQNFWHGGPPETRARWDFAREKARAWLGGRNDSYRLSRLLPPTGRTSVHDGDQPTAEDVRRMRR